MNIQGESKKLELKISKIRRLRPKYNEENNYKKARNILLQPKEIVIHKTIEGLRTWLLGFGN